MQRHPFSPAQPVFLVVATDIDKPIGTCFPVEEGGWFLTSAHILEAVDQDAVRIEAAHGGIHSSSPVDAVIPHPGADIALLVSKQAPAVKNPFVAARPRTGMDFLPGEWVVSCGYTVLKNRNKEAELDARLMHGRIQKHRLVTCGDVQYTRYELSFPSLAGNSGSPVCLDSDWRKVMGVVTHGLTVQSATEEDNEVKTHWTVAVSLPSINDWRNESLGRPVELPFKRFGSLVRQRRSN